MADQQLFVQNQATTLAGAGVSQGDTSIVLSSLTQIDGTLLTMSDFGSKGYATIEPGNGTQEEAITFTGITQNINGTATLTGVKNQSTVSPYTETSGLSMTHAGGTTLIITNTAGFYDGLSGKSNDETVTGKWTFPGGGSANAPVSGTQYAEPTDTLEYASKGYVDSVAIAGGAKASNTVYGLTRLSTAAVVATEPIAVGDNDTRVPTQNENNALVGNDPVTSPSSTNKYMTQSGFQRGTEIYAYSSTQTDAYAVTLSPAVTSYVEGMLVRFKADVGNVGTATLAVSGLSPITIKKNVTENLADNDIQGSQVVEVIYDANPSPAFQLIGANFISKANATTLTNGSNAGSLHNHPPVIIQSTRAMNTASGSVNYAHGLGRTPTWIKVNATLSNSTGSGKLSQSFGVYNGTNYSIWNGFQGNGSAVAPINGTSNTFTVYILTDASDTTSGHSSLQTATVTLNSTNVVLSWTYTDNETPDTTDTIQLQIEVY